MTRIPIVPEGKGNPFVRYAFRATRKKLGRIPTPLGVTAHSPKLLAGYGALETAVERLDQAPKKLVALGEMRIAALVGCEFCIDIGTWLSRDEGITEDQIRDLHRWRDSPHFDDLERLVLTVADGMTATPCEVPADTIAQLRERLGDQGVVELVGVLALENYRARFNWTFDIGPDGFAEGMVCALPAKEAEAAEAAA